MWIFSLYNLVGDLKNIPVNVTILIIVFSKLRSTFHVCFFSSREKCMKFNVVPFLAPSDKTPKKCYTKKKSSNPPSGMSLSYPLHMLKGGAILL